LPKCFLACLLPERRANPAKPEQRKSKDPEDVAFAMQLQGVLLKTFFEYYFPAMMEKSMSRISTF
jgi:hypothetical protein